MTRRAVDSNPSRGLSIEEVLALPVSFDLVTAGRAWDFGRTKSHELARQGQFPCPVLRIGNAYRVTRADLLRSLGIDPAGTETVTSSNAAPPKLGLVDTGGNGAA